MITIKNEEYLNTKEAAEYIGKARQTVYQFHKVWNWPPYQFGPKLLFKRKDIDKWLSEQIKPGRPLNAASQY